VTRHAERCIEEGNLAGIVTDAGFDSNHAVSLTESGLTVRKQILDDP
jgi:hypothetical protein